MERVKCMRKFFELSGSGIVWKVKRGQVHFDDIEMSGFGSSYIISYGVDAEGQLHLSRHCVFPTLRTIPNDTHASFQLDISPEKIPQILINGSSCMEYAAEFEIDGFLTVRSKTGKGLTVQRCFYPSSRSRCDIERIMIRNDSDGTVDIEIAQDGTTLHSLGRGTKGVYIVEVSHDGPKNIKLLPGETLRFHTYYTARIADEVLIIPDGDEELRLREARVRELSGRLRLETGNPVVDTMYRFAKIRAGESIFETRAGLLHSPGGRSYYAATWCNDEIEYAGPWFAMTGDKSAVEASVNAYRQYIPFMSDAYMRIPSSVIAEGADIWEGAGDRGDAAMYLYGASLFSLFLGDMDVAGVLWPAIKWCAEYCETRKSPEGVIMSDSDELEGRFPTDGKANLSTSSLCYGGLRLAAVLAKAMGEPELARIYSKRAAELEIAIEEYFGAKLHGFDTYRYSQGYDTLRAWICLPLCVGISKRAEGTIEAMLSEYLWTHDGMLSCELGDENPNKTIWDRSTLYGFRCAFLAGKGDKIWQAFEGYCEKRLLGDRVPYPVEAWPEGDKRHLSAESALFCRIITEGILGMTPLGMNSFSFTPRLPGALNRLYLTNIHAFGAVFDIFVDKDNYRVSAEGRTISQGNNGHTVTVDFCKQ